MGVHKTTQQRDALKRQNRSAAYAKQVNLMTPDQVDAEYHRVIGTYSLQRSSK